MLLLLRFLSILPVRFLCSRCDQAEARSSGAAVNSSDPLWLPFDSSLLNGATTNGINLSLALPVQDLLGLPGYVPVKAYGK
jgi:hypothetical protein